MDLKDSWLESGNFTWDAGYGLASVCKLAYREPRVAAALTGKLWGLKGTGLRAGAAEALVVEGDVSVVVGFRGTDGLLDWLRNIDVAPSVSKELNGSLHAGFLQAFREVSHLVDRALEGTHGKTLWFTGHSLGGALALIAAGNLIEHRQSRVVTFGQPRMLKPDAADFVRTRFGERYVRVVNDNDVFARIPPNYGHAGRLLHFDFDGSLRAASESVEIDAEGPRPLSEAQFRELMESLERLDNSQVVGADASDRALEGLIPGVPEHRIDSYLRVMRRQADKRKESGAEEELARLPMRRPGERVALAVEGSELISTDHREYPALLRLKTMDWVAPSQVSVQSRFGKIATVLVTREGLSNLARDDSVDSLELSRDASGFMELDRSVPFVRGDAVQRPPLGEKGDAALIGIIDSGIDILHEAFLDGRGESRILAIWDQTETDPARTPKALNPAAFTQTYGRLYLNRDIMQFRADHRADKPSHPRKLRDPNGHGTHVAGIAAGRRCGGMASGIAPEAGIVMVIASVREKPDNPPSLGYSMSHVDALAFLKRVSEGGTVVCSQPRPMAINISLGMNAGAHDGSTTLEIAFDTITNGGQTEGLVIVKSAGNERGLGGHTRVSPFVGGVMPVEWISSATFRSEDYLEAWYDGMDDLAFTVVDPEGRRSGEVSSPQQTFDGLLGGNRIRLKLTENQGDGGANKMTLTIYADPDPIQIGTWSLEVEGKRIVSKDSPVNVWIERDDSRPLRFRVEDPEMTLSVPGTARSVVCVGASDTSQPLRLLGASSWGPTRDRRAKPELCAPGYQIVSAKSGAGPTDTIAMSGTSMAAPHVTGALALVLSAQVKAGISMTKAVQFQTALKKTVKGLPHGHNVAAGFGVLDVEALFGNLVQRTF